MLDQLYTKIGDTLDNKTKKRDILILCSALAALALPKDTESYYKKAIKLYHSCKNQTVRITICNMLGRVYPSVDSQKQNEIFNILMRRLKLQSTITLDETLPHRIIVITPKEINQIGLAITVPVTSGGNYARIKGLTVSITGHDTTGVADCNQVRSFDIEERIKNGSAKYIETLDKHIVAEIILKVISIIDHAA